jgi:transcription initiation factor TFIIE subunit alpha
MIEKFLSEYISTIAGSGADKILSVLFNKKNVNEFLIAKKLNMTINQARNILYKLVDAGLVYFMRKKDLKSGGWYTYFWTLDEHKCLVNYKASVTKEIENLENSLQVQKTKQFYVCKNCGIEVSDEQALINQFTCVECGEVYSLKDSAESVKEIEKVIQRLKLKASQIQEVLDQINEKLAKSSARSLKKSAKKLAKSSVKKPAKSKPKKPAVKSKKSSTKLKKGKKR